MVSWCHVCERVPCIQFNVEAMFHLETDELGCANVAVLRIAEK